VEKTYRKLLTVAEAAAQLGMKESTVRQWIWLRQIDFVKVGRSVRLKAETLDRLVEMGTVPARDNKR